MSGRKGRHSRRRLARFRLLAAVVVLLAAGAGEAALAAAPPAASEPLSRAATALEQGRVRQAVTHLLAAAKRWPESPEVQRNLALAYYDLRLLDESVAAMRRAVALAPDEALYRMELGALFLAADTPDLALEQLFAALERNPGLGEAYWYLGRLYIETEQPALARRALTRAEQLGIETGWLRERLAAAGARPSTAGGDDRAVSFELSEKGEKEKIALRMLPVADQEAGERLLAAMSKGEILFEFADNRPEVTAPVRNGGYVGALAPSELDPAVCRAICGQPPFAPPQLVMTGEQALVVQRLAPFDPASWRPTRETTPEPLAARRASGAGDQAIGDEEGLLRTSVDLHKRRVYAAALADRQRALALVRRLRREGLPAFCVYDPGKKFPYMVLAGEYEEARAAIAARQRLVALGFTDAFLSAPRSKKPGAAFSTDR